MKVFGKIFIIVSLFLFTVDADAQMIMRRKIFGDFRVGGNSSEMDIAGANRDKKVKIGFHIGGTIAYKFYDDFYLQTGLFLTKKGMVQKVHSESINGAEKIVRDVKTTTDANYVLMPLMGGYEFKLNESLSLNIGAGLYGAWGFKGDTKQRGEQWDYIGSMVPEKPTLYIKEDDDTFSSAVLKRFDYGAIGSVGLVYEIYTLNLGYEYGLCDVSNDGSNKLKNRNLTVSIGFRF